MDLNQFTQYFDNPKVSVFNRSKKASFPMRIGPLYATYWDLCSFGNSHKGSSFHSMRLAPMLAPNFSDLRLQEHVGVIPLRVIMKDFEEKFNYATNIDGASLPHFSSDDYHRCLLAMCIAGINPIGSLLDFLGYPVYADLYDAMIENLSTARYANNDGIRFDIFHITSDLNELPSDTQPFGFEYSFTYRNATIDFSNQLEVFSVQPITFQQFIYMKTLRLSVYRLQYDYNSYVSSYPFDSLDDLIKWSIFDTIQSATDAYLNYLFGVAFVILSNQGVFDGLSTVYTTLPLRAYWRFHYDWNVNGNFVDRDIQLEDNVYGFEDKVISASTGIITNVEPAVSVQILHDLLLPANRLWDNDFFTSLLPTSAVDNAITIPANATVLDLAKLTAVQKLVLKLSYSSRFRDVVWNIFKIKPSDARLQQSSVIMQKTHNIGIGETLQTSESSVSSVQGNPAGRGYSSGKNSGYHIFCEEPCVILQFASFVPRASYADAIHPLIHVSDILDFPIPDMDVLGNQPIYADLLSGNAADSDVVLGYGRQYFDWLAQYNTVHGEFKTTLSYWQLTRRFNETPAINDDFLRIDDHDDFDKIFSMPESSHAFIDFFYNCHASRHVHRNVRIQI